MTTQQTDTDALREQVRARYAAAATKVTSGQGGCGCGQPADCGCGSGCCGGVQDEQPGIGAGLYAASDREVLPDAAVLASLGCGNPTAVAELREGEAVLDLGSGGGIDVLLSARRVGPTGKAYGLDMTEEMLALARRNTAEAGAINVDFLKGQIEAIPLPAATVDVVISNCVINLSTDKPAVFERPSGSSGRAGAWASPTWSPRTTSAQRTGPSGVPGWAASPGHCRRPSTRCSWPRPGSPGSRSASPTRSATACTRPSSRPPSQPTRPRPWPCPPPSVASSRSSSDPAAADLIQPAPNEGSLVRGAGPSPSNPTRAHHDQKYRQSSIEGSRSTS